MKKIVFLSLAAFTALTFASCKSSKSATTVTSPDENPFGESYEMPCTIYDTEENFAATGTFIGSSKQLGEVQKNALLNAQDLIRNKMASAYKGMVSEYSASVGNNSGNDIERKMTSAGDKIIDVFVNNTSASCLKWSKIGADGHITCYIAILIPKAKAAAQIASEVADKLTQEEKDRIGFNEQEYRKQMEDRFKQYKENKK
ncbi:MAG: hypothetical protein MJ009_03960 [Paludibacteraceae bacterium]|nr:hypothetical protein [Paludibacteraceae bacterium]